MNASTRCLAATELLNYFPAEEQIQHAVQGAYDYQMMINPPVHTFSMLASDKKENFGLKIAEVIVQNTEKGAWPVAVGRALYGMTAFADEEENILVESGYNQGEVNITYMKPSFYAEAFGVSPDDLRDQFDEIDAKERDGNLVAEEVQEFSPEEKIYFLAKHAVVLQTSIKLLKKMQKTSEDISPHAKGLIGHTDYLTSIEGNLDNLSGGHEEFRLLQLVRDNLNTALELKSELLKPAA